MRHRRSSRGFARLACVGCLVAVVAISLAGESPRSAVAASPGWTQLSPGAAPEPRQAPSLALDEASGRLVLFGGGRPSCAGNRADTWEFDGTDWQQMPVAGPPGREDAGMAYDGARDRTVLFGGFVGGRLDDTWEYDGSSWQQIATATAPSARSSLGMAFDAARGKVVLFGGNTAGGGLSDETWEYDGVWTRVDPAQSPAPRWGTRLVAAPSLGGVLLFGGSGVGGVMLGDAWLFDGREWTQLASGPTGRYYHQLAYDPGRDRVVLFGGIRIESGHVVPQNDTWEFDGGSWRRIDLGAPPPRTWGAGMAYLPSVAGLVMFGGNEPYQCDSSDATWAYVPGGDAGPPPPPPQFGTTLFDDDFEDGDADGWTEAAGTWQVANGRYGSTVPCGVPQGRPGASRTTVGDASWSDYRLDLDFVATAGQDREIAWRYRDEGNHYLVSFPESGAIYVHRISSAGHDRWYEAVDPLYNGTPHRVTIVAEGERFRVYLDGRLIHDVLDAGTPLTAGGIALYSGFSVFCPTTVFYDNVRVTSGSAAANGAPIADAGGPYAADEGTDVVLDGSASMDPDAGDGIVRYEWDLDYDGESFDVDTEGEEPTVVHAYPDDGNVVVALRVVDTLDEVSEVATAEVVISNVAPGVSAPEDQEAEEGTGTSIDLGSFTDPGDDGPWTVTVAWGDGSDATVFEAADPGALGPGEHRYDDGPATYTVTVTVAEAGGLAVSDPPGGFGVAVGNVPPTAELVVAPDAIAEGDGFVVSLVDAVDASEADAAAGFTYAFDCGDGYELPSADASATCNADDDPDAAVRAKIIDKDGGESENGAAVPVANLAPTLGPLLVLPDGPIKVGDPVAVRAEFTDAGVLDTHDAVIDWGDGTSSTATVTEDGGRGTVKGTHQYAAGTYRITLMVNDGDGGGATASATVAVKGPKLKLKLGPTSGRAESRVEVSGSNFTPGEVAISWDDGTSLGTATVGADGSFVATVTIPAGAPAGKHAITATDAGGATASKDFTVKRR